MPTSNTPIHWATRLLLLIALILIMLYPPQSPAEWVLAAFVMVVSVVHLVQWIRRV